MKGVIQWVAGRDGRGPSRPVIRATRVIKSLRHYADDRKRHRVIVRQQLSAKYGDVTSESPLPRRVAQYNCVCCSDDIISRPKSAADRRLDAQHVEESAGHENLAETRDSISFAHRLVDRTVVGHKCDFVERVRSTCKLECLIEAKRPVRAVTPFAPQHHDAALIANGETADQHRVRHLEYRRRETNAERKGQHDRQAERRRAAKAAEGDANVLLEVVHEYAVSCLARFLAEPLHASERQEGGPTRISRRQSARKMVFRLHFEMETHFFVRIFAQTSPIEEAAHIGDERS